MEIQSKKYIRTNNKTIEYANAPCGGGKSFASNNFIENNQKQNYLLICPSNKLAKQHYEKLKDLLYNEVYLVNQDSKNYNSTVIETFDSKLKYANELYENYKINYTFILSQKPYTDLIKEHINFDYDNTILIIDECFDVDKEYQYTLPYYSNLISDYVDTISINDNIYELKIKPEKHNLVLDIINRNNNIVNNIQKTIFDNILQGNRTLVYKKSWDNLVIKKEITKDDKKSKHENAKNTIYLNSVLNPRHFISFKKTIILSAFIEERMLFKQWSKLYSDIVEFKKSDLQFRYNKNPNNGKIKLVYFLNKDDKFSITSLSTFNEKENKTNIEVYLQKIKKLYRKWGNKSTKPILSLNNTFKLNDKIDTKMFDLVSSKSHGLNEYSDRTDSIFISAFNKKLGHRYIMLGLGYTDEDIYRNMTLDPAYQFILRTILRVLGYDCETLHTLPSLAMCLDIAEKFDNPCDIAFIDDCLFVETRKDFEQCFKKSDTLIKKTKVKNIHNDTKKTINKTLETFNNALVALKSQSLEVLNQEFNKNEYLITKFDSYYDTTAKTSVFDIKDAIDLIYKMNNSVFNEKQEIPLITGTYFLNEDRSKTNAIGSKLLFLDYDNCSLSKEQLESLLQKIKRTCVFHSSPSRSELKPNNFKTIFFLDKFVNDKDYHNICLILNEQLKELSIKGYGIELTGLDMSKCNLSSMFHHPAKLNNKISREWNFIKKIRTLSQDLALKTSIIDTEQLLKELTKYPDLLKETTKQIQNTNIKNTNTFSNGYCYSEKLKQEIIDECYQMINNIIPDDAKYGRYITGYEIVVKKLSKIKHYHDFYLVADEIRNAYNLKCDNSKRSIDNFDELLRKL